MYIAPIEFDEVRHWFLNVNTRFHHLCMFLTGNGDYNDIINEEILRNRYLIDRTTGNGICYFFCSSFGIEGDIDIFNRWNIRNRKLTNSIESMLLENQKRRLSDYTPASLQSELLREDVCDYYHISRSSLPALVFINKKEEIYLYPIKGFKDIKALLTPLGIISDFLKDKKEIERRLLEIKSKKEWGNDIKKEEERLRDCISSSVQKFKELQLNVDADYIIDQCANGTSGIWLIPVLKASQESRYHAENNYEGKMILKCFIAGAKSLERERDAIISGINDQNIANKHSRRYIECYTFNNFDLHLTKEGQQAAL